MHRGVSLVQRQRHLAAERQQPREYRLGDDDRVTMALSDAAAFSARLHAAWEAGYEAEDQRRRERREEDMRAFRRALEKELGRGRPGNRPLEPAEAARATQGTRAP